MKHDTRADIRNALNQLLEKYSFDDITVQMILEKAEISKATFYRHFKDKQEVLCSNYDMIFGNSLKSSHSLVELQTNLSLELSRLGKRVCQEILKYNGDNNYADYVYEASMSFLLKLYRIHYNRDEMHKDQLFQCRIVLSGIVRNLDFLVLNKTPEEMQHETELL